MGTDRSTAIHADQIKNNTLTPDEFDSENFITDFSSDIVFTYSHSTNKIKYQKKEDIASVETHFTTDENNDVTFKTLPIFILDGNGNLMISENGTEDPFFTIDADNNVTLKT